MKKLIIILIILAVLVTTGFWISKNKEEPINLKHYCETKSDCVVSGRDPAGYGTCLNKTWNEEWDKNPKSVTWECIAPHELTENGEWVSTHKCGCINNKCERTDSNQDC